MIKHIKDIAVLIVVILIIIAIAPFVIVIGVPFLIISKIGAMISLRSFLRRNAGQVYLICTSRRNWHDFLNNNVIPVLPDNFHAVWHNATRWDEPSRIFKHLDYLRIFSVSKPYLVVVTHHALLHKSINPILQELKDRPKKSDQTQRDCAQVIAQTVSELQASVG